MSLFWNCPTILCSFPLLTLPSPPHPAFPSSPCLPPLTLPSPPHPAFPSSPCLPLLVPSSPSCTTISHSHNMFCSSPHTRTSSRPYGHPGCSVDRWDLIPILYH